MTVGDKVELADVMTRSRVYMNVVELEIRHIMTHAELSLHDQEVIRTVWHLSQ